MKVAKILNRIAQYKQADIFWAGQIGISGPIFHNCGNECSTILGILFLGVDVDAVLVSVSAI